MGDKKISLLTSYSYQTGSGDIDIDSIINTEVITPVVVNNENRKLNIGNIFHIIKQYFLEKVGEAVQDYINDNPEIIGEISNPDLTSVKSDVTSIKSRLDNLEDITKWPVNYITLKKGNIQIPYALPSYPLAVGYKEGEIVIEVDNITLPDLHVATNIASASITGTTANISALVTISNTHSSLVLNGNKTITSIELSGSITLSDKSVYEISKMESVNLVIPEGTTPASSTTTINLSTPVPSGANIYKASLKCKINNTEVTGTAERIEGTSIEGAGFITLSNGS